jgi:hypothetical protein
MQLQQYSDREHQSSDRSLATKLKLIPSVPWTRLPITGLASGKDILVVGACGNYKGRRPGSKWEQEWEFYNLKTHCRNIVGIDINADFVALAQKDGHDIRLENAETFDLGTDFDLIC